MEDHIGSLRGCLEMRYTFISSVLIPLELSHKDLSDY